MDSNLGQVILVKDINVTENNYSSYPQGSYPNNLIEFNDELYFTANDGVNGGELWVSDGTTEGTTLLKDIRPGTSNYGFAYGSYPSNLTEFNDQLYFSADDGVNGTELWVSDGTTEGTTLLKDIDPGTSNYGGDGSYPSDFTEFNDQLYFSAGDEVNGIELWVSDGTTEGTTLLKDINPGTSNYGFPNGSYPSDFTEFNDQLYFTAGDGVNGGELWVSDGTTEGTTLLKDIRPGTSNYGYAYGSYPSDLTEFNDQLYFSANDGVNGIELWVSDGTTEGTTLLKDIRPGTNNYGYAYGSGSYPSDLTEFNDQLYFSANDGVNGIELWVSDGTTEGTTLLKDIRPGTSNYGYAYGSYPSDLTEFNDQLYFSANDGVNGGELWVSDGTTEGTSLVADINPGSNNYGFPNSSYPSNLTVVNDELFFSANDGVNGTELFKLAIDDSTNVVTGTDRSDNIAGGDGNDRLLGLDGKDTLDGGGGNDTLIGGDGRDSLIGGDGNDELVGEDGKDILDGGAGDDNLFGGEGQDSLIGGDGNDLLLGEDGRDTLNGGAGHDLLLGGSGRDSLVGGDGNDELLGEDGRDTLNGGMGHDILTGGSGTDIFVIQTGEGEDTISDFEIGHDRLGISADIQYDHLTLEGNTIKAGDELLATLDHVNTAHLTEHDFLTI